MKDAMKDEMTPASTAVFVRKSIDPDWVRWAVYGDAHKCAWFYTEKDAITYRDVLLRRPTLDTQGGGK